MSRGPTRNANPARPVRCSAGCGTLVWLAGALPTTADAAFVCSSCDTATQIELLPTKDLPLGGHQLGSGRRFLPGQCHLHPSGEGCRCTQ